MHVSEVDAGKEGECECPECGNALWARKGAARRHHFYHVVQNPACSAETLLHKLGKRILRERIDAALASKQRLEISWVCGKCEDQHKANLLLKAASVQNELPIGSARADLALFNDAGKPYIAVEIVVSHEPDLLARTVYKVHRVTCVEFSVQSGDDLMRLRDESPLVASAVSYCAAPKCRCGGVQFQRQICVLELPCWKCKRLMKVSYGYFGFGPEPPSSYKLEEIAYARTKGVKLERRHSGVVNRAYMMNVCPHCNRPWGDHYSGALWQDFGKHPMQTVLLECEDCGVLQRAPTNPTANSS